MKRAIMCAVAVMLVLAATAVTSSAAGVRVRMHEPRTIGAEKVRLAGMVHGRDVVRIQRFARASKRWVTIRKVEARSDGHFRTTVRASRHRRVFRATAGPVSSERLVVPAAPVAPAVDAPSDECGPRPAKGDGSYWACTLAEDFDGTELDRALWRPASGFLGGTAPARPCYVDDPSVISVADGRLRLSARALPEPVRCAGTSADPTGYIAGGINTYRLFSQQYGRFEARVKASATSELGLQEAFWLWPDDRYSTGYWPAAGEIDIAETYSQYPNLAIPYLHYTWNDNWGPVPGLNTAWNCAAQRGAYNTFTLEWSARRLEILVNGRTCLVNTSGDPAFQKPYIVALTQLMGTGANMYVGKAPLPATMSVDYVRVWK